MANVRLALLSVPIMCTYLMYSTVLVCLNVYGAQDSIPRNEFRQPM
jgi:hypothetical protein